MRIEIDLPDDYVEEMDSVVKLDSLEDRESLIKELLRPKFEDYDVYSCIACGTLTHVFGGKQYDDGFVCFNCCGDE